MTQTWILSVKAATVALSSSALDFFLCLPKHRAFQLGTRQLKLCGIMGFIVCQWGSLGQHQSRVGATPSCAVQAMNAVDYTCALQSTGTTKAGKGSSPVAHLCGLVKLLLTPRPVLLAAMRASRPRLPRSLLTGLQILALQAMMAA